MQSQILVWPLPLRGEISHGQHGRWHPGLSIHHHQEGGSCCQQQVGAAVSRLGFVLDGESVYLGSGWSVSTTPTYASCAKSQFHHLCAHNLKTRWGPQARRSVDWRKMDSSGGQNSGAEPVNNNQLIIFDQTTISKVVTTRQPQKEGFLWDSMVRPCVGGWHSWPEASSQVSPITWTEISSSTCWGRFQPFISKAMPAENRFLFHSSVGIMLLSCGCGWWRRE